MNRKDILLFLLTGVLVFLSFPKPDLGFLIWIALVPLLISIRNKDIAAAFRVGFSAGIVYNAGLLYWIVFVVVQYGRLPIYAGIAVMLLLVTYLSLYTGIFCAGIAYFRRRRIGAVFVAPFLWVFLEYLKGHLFSGFPWEDLGYSQHAYLSMIQIVDITGVCGISFLIVFINCVFCDAICGFFLASSEKRKLPIIEISMALALFMGVLGYGLYRMDLLQSYEGDLEPLHTLIVQGNIDQSLKWNDKFKKETVEIYTKLSADASKDGTSLIVWPETAAPFFFQDYGDMTREIIATVRKAGAWFLFGAPAYNVEMGKASFLNSAYLLSPQGVTAGRYDKVHLVPFGEYVPLQRFVPFIGKLVVGAGDFRKGSSIEPLDMGGNKIGVLICYEGIFPEISRKFRSKGAALLVNITNDAWYGETSAPYQHLTMAAFRAIENRVYMIRAANTGISAVVDPLGRIVSRTGIFEREVLEEDVKFTFHPTFYSKYGNIFACLCFGFLLIGALVSLRRKVL